MEKSMKRYMPIFVFPTFFAFILGFIIPFILGVGLSFCKFTTVTDAKFIGFSNYVEALKDTVFRHSFWYTTLFAVTSLIVINVFAFALAMALTQKLRGTNIFRTIFFLPNLIGGIVLGYIWQLIFNGILAKYETALALNEWYGFWGLIILVSWQQIGYMMIIYIAGLQSIPGDVIEAAQIDGASRFQRLWKVTVPMMMPSITICVFLSITNGFKLFDQNLSLTAGEPSKMSEMMALNIFNTFYGRTGWEGVGQAKAVLFFILVVNGILAKYETALALNEWYGFWGLIILVSWQQIGYMMIIYIAGLQSIPGDVIEAAQIDGASRFQRLWKVTVPMMMPSITICVFLSITNGFKLFDQNLSLTAGEPSKMSEMMALNIFNTFYGRTGWEGVGQAKAVLFFILVVAIGMVQLRMTRSKEVQQ